VHQQDRIELSYEFRKEFVISRAGVTELSRCAKIDKKYNISILLTAKGDYSVRKGFSFDSLQKLMQYKSRVVAGMLILRPAASVVQLPHQRP